MTVINGRLSVALPADVHDIFSKVEHRQRYTIKALRALHAMEENLLAELDKAEPDTDAAFAELELSISMTVSNWRSEVARAVAKKLFFITDPSKAEVYREISARAETMDPVIKALAFKHAE